MALVWPELVGAEVAANARPQQLKNGRLIAAASSAVWAQTLQLMSEDIKARLNQRLGAGTVREIVFRHAGWEDRPQSGGAGRAASGAGDLKRGTATPGCVDAESGDTPAGAHGAASVAAGPLTAEQQTALDAVSRLSLPPDLREQIGRAMRASFRRSSGRK